MLVNHCKIKSLCMTDTSRVACSRCGGWSRTNPDCLISSGRGSIQLEEIALWLVFTNLEYSSTLGTLLRSFVVGALVVFLQTRFLGHAVGQLLGGSFKDLDLVVALFHESVALIDELAGLSVQEAGLLLRLFNLHQPRTLLPRQLLEDLLHVVTWHRLVLVADKLRFMEP